MAMQLLRQAWKNCPLSEAEDTQLCSIDALATQTGQAPGLKLLVHEMRSSIHQLRHLYPSPAAPSQPLPPPRLDPDAAIGYMCDTKPHMSSGWAGFAPNPRAMLTQLELQRVLRIPHKPPPQPAWVKAVAKGRGQLHVPSSPVPPELIASTEQELQSLVSIPEGPPSTSIPPYPLVSSTGTASSTDEPTLERLLHKELQGSWEAHHKLPKIDQLSMLPEALCARVEEILVCAACVCNSIGILACMGVCGLGCGHEAQGSMPP
jgi:hypothetical protein